MKRILITGMTSNTGDALAEFVGEFHKDEYIINRCSLRGDDFLSMDWSIYDVVLHTVGVVKLKRIKTYQDEEKYCNRINRDLALKAAKKAKKDGVTHFVFLSTMMVYGESAPIGSHFTIDKDTIPVPVSNYGKSKLEAERLICSLEDDCFRVTIVREPVVYGEHFSGEFYKLQKLAKRVRCFPLIDSTKSYIYEGNLCELICQIIQNNCYGIVHPQNFEVLITSELYSKIVSFNGKKCILIKGLKGLLLFLSRFTKYVNAVFNDMNYSADLSMVPGISYQIFSLEESLRRCQN